MMVIVPNSKLSGDNITNFTTRPTRRVETFVGISYSDNIDHARRTILDEIAKNSRIFADPPPSVRVANRGDSSVKLQVWAWLTDKTSIAGG